MNENDRVKVYNDDLASTGMPRNLFLVLSGRGVFIYVCDTSSILEGCKEHPKGKEEIK